eukprot:TRINITY_DN107647_c0_g1_i1.p1 TRINITY_DN107647_c0_g1~~TRINITY_DN107647_c0_g1_i1.p1  ORF type:complete len:414 (+),score=159.55 TRINITY_DN107647_c0_g1_i1:48-1244(+)
MAKDKKHMPKVKDMKQWRKEQKEKKKRYQQAMEWKQAAGTWTKARPEGNAEAKAKKKKGKNSKAEKVEELEQTEAHEEEPVQAKKSKWKKKKKRAEEREGEEQPEAQEEEPVHAKKSKSKTKKTDDEEREPAQEETTDAVQKTRKSKRKQSEADNTLEETSTTQAEELAQPKKKKKKKQAEEDVQDAEAEEIKPKKKAKAKTDEAEEVAGASDDPEAFKAVVAGIPVMVDEKGVRKHFSQCGEILSLRLLKDKETWKSRGIAFISFTDQVSLDAALELDGTDFRGRALAIQVAKQGGAKGKGDGKGKVQAPGKKPKGCKSVIVKGLAYSVTEADLKKLFKACGELSDVKILTNRDTGASKGMAFLDFESSTAVDEAIKLNGSVLKGRRFSVDYATPRW